MFVIWTALEYAILELCNYYLCNFGNAFFASINLKEIYEILNDLIYYTTYTELKNIHNNLVLSLKQIHLSNSKTNSKSMQIFKYADIIFILLAFLGV